jgi:hypothetical protein
MVVDDHEVVRAPRQSNPSLVGLLSYPPASVTNDTDTASYPV